VNYEEAPAHLIGASFLKPNAMKLFICLLFLILTFLPTSGMSAGINVQAKIATIDAHDVTVLTILNGGKSVATVKYEGAVRSIKVNEDKTICAINLEPGTQINDVYLVDSMPSGKTLVIKDFNDKLIRALGDKAERLNTDYISIDRIEGKILDVSLGSKEEPTYSLKATLTRGGTIEVVPHSISKD
jgi:hypothetical protein